MKEYYIECSCGLRLETYSLSVGRLVCPKCKRSLCPNCGEEVHRATGVADSRILAGYGIAKKEVYFHYCPHCSFGWRKGKNLLVAAKAKRKEDRSRQNANFAVQSATPCSEDFEGDTITFENNVQYPWGEEA